MSTRNYPVLIVIRGIPGSGKSHLAAALHQSLRESAGENGVVMLDPDTTDYDSPEYTAHTKAMIAEGVDPKIHPYRFLRGRAYQAIVDHRIIIWNQPFTNLDMFNRMTTKLRDHATEHDTHLPLLIVEVELDRAIARERVLERKRQGGHGPSDKTLAQRMDDYRSFADKGYDTVTVKGDDDVSESVKSISKALKNLS